MNKGNLSMIGDVAKIEWDSKNHEDIKARTAVFYHFRGLHPKLSKKPQPLDTKVI